MEAQIQHLIESFLAWMAVPQVGLLSVFLVSLIGATLLPLASEPMVYLMVKSNPEMFWPAIVVATIGNTMGGAISWWMGYGAERAYEAATHKQPGNARALAWLRRFGPPALLLSWLPVVGDPLCAVAGWLRLPFWHCAGFMALGKFIRYFLMTAALIWVWPASH